ISGLEASPLPHQFRRSGALTMEFASALKGLRARFGAFATLGNHDWWYNGSCVKKALETAGITVLENDVAIIEAPIIAITHIHHIFPFNPREGCANNCRAHTRRPSGARAHTRRPSGAADPWAVDRTLGFRRTLRRRPHC